MRTLTSLLLAALMSTTVYADPWELEFGAAFGMSDSTIADVAYYEFTDGSRDELFAGDGFFVLLGRNLTDLGPLTLNLKGGFHTGAMSYSDSSNELKDRMIYFPTYFSAQWPVSESFAVSGGASYLLLPSYKREINNYWEKVSMKSNIGYTVEGRYIFEEGVAALSVRYTSNTLSYTDGETSEGDTFDASPIRDEEVDVLSFSLMFAF